MSVINQKEYLKKYLGIGKGSGDKKKKKKIKKVGNGLKIVDDDIGVSLNAEIQLDLTADNEEAPQIVSVIDDRPPSLRIDEETHSKLWKPIGAPSPSEQVEKGMKFEGNIKLGKNLGKRASAKNIRDFSPSRKYSRESQKTEKRENSSPVRRGSPNIGAKHSPVPSKKIKQESVSSEKDFSPVRHQRGNEDISPPRRSTKDRDNSPVSKKKKSDDFSPPRRKDSKEMSPIRLTRLDSDYSPPRRNRTGEDLSPIRKRGLNSDADCSPPRKIQTKNMSPPKKVNSDGDSLPQKIKQTKDMSPPRRTGDNSDSSSSIRNSSEKNDDLATRKVKLEKGDHLPRKKSREHKKSRWGDSEESSEKMEKTLDGKTAGLQNAADLVQETQELKKREDELFKKLSSEVSGANAATVVRRKNKEVDFEEEERKRKIEEENKEMYMSWGRGLKQVDDVNEKIKNDMHEMNKPLARYADDEDLERHLKDQERDGDPMLAYIRQKKRKQAVDSGATPVIQQYEGDAPPNRFGIRPGYRWDGVDRSTGYERKWFEVQNSKMASMEENYKWSTEDM